MTADRSYSTEALLSFLKEAGMGGLINPAAARARRNAIDQLKGELTDAERADVRRIDVDRLASRFHKLEESSIRIEVLAIYAQRFCVALADFLAWKENPAGFQSVAGEQARAMPRGSISDEQRAAERIALLATEKPSEIVPIPLRESCTVYVANLPADLEPREAERIARIIRAYAIGQPGPDGEDER